MAENSDLRVRRGTTLGVLTAATASLAFSGCIAGSLATSTGGGGSEWSIEPRQLVHVGETVRFSFVLKQPLEQNSINALGLADYCIFEFGGEAEEVEVNDEGSFRTERTFSDLEPEEIVEVRATAYLERGRRDQARIGGEWFKADDSQDVPDRKIAGDKVLLRAYRSRVEIELPPAADEYDFSTAQLVLRGREDQNSIVYEKRPPREGFVKAPAADGGWRITYEPDGNEVDPCGLTEVEFSIYDFAGNRCVFEDTLETP